MVLKTKLTEALGIKHPIIQGIPAIAAMGCLPYRRLANLASLLLIVQQLNQLTFVSISTTIATRFESRTTLAAEGDLFGQVAELFEGPTFEEGEQWRALTRIKVRREPSINSQQLEDQVIEKGETFFVAEVRRAKIPTGLSCSLG
eukprot:symbB.v1.2.010260.t1/scaffold670.1/size174347/11